MFFYSIFNLKDCIFCTQELYESFWGLTKVYLLWNCPKKAKWYFLSAYNIMIANNSVYIEEEVEYLFNKLGITIADILKKR